MKRWMLALMVALLASVAYAQEQPTQWREVPGVNLSIGFAEGWGITEDNGKIIASSPDESVHIFAAVFPKVEEVDGEDTKQHDARVIAVRNELVADYLTDFELAQKKTNFRKIDNLGGAISNEGTAKAKSTDQPVQWRGDSVMLKDGNVLVIAYGSEQALDDHSDAIKMTRASYKQAN